MACNVHLHHERLKGNHLQYKTLQQDVDRCMLLSLLLLQGGYEATSSSDFKWS